MIPFLPAAPGILPRSYAVAFIAAATRCTVEPPLLLIFAALRMLWPFNTSLLLGEEISRF
jgi:hypothetical protein